MLKEILRLSLVHDCDAKMRTHQTMEALCEVDSLVSFMVSLVRFKGVFATFTSFDAEVFLGVLEFMVLRRNPTALLSSVYKILHCLYDEDIAEEEHILAWADLAPDKALIVNEDEAKSIRQHAEPFIK